MKIRNGFVSNSSSSSFVLIGIKVADKGELELFARKFGYIPSEDADDWEVDEFFSDSPNGIDIISTDDDWFLGKLLAESNDDYMEDHEFSFDMLKDISETLCKTLELPSDRVKLYTGTRPS